MAKNLRVGSRVRVSAHFTADYHGRTGKIVKMPGGTGRYRSGTAGFKFVKFDDTGNVLGFFSHELERARPDASKQYLDASQGV